MTYPKLFIYPYNQHSESAKLLAERLGAKRIKLENSEYVHKPENLVINWGNSNCPYPCLNPGPVLKRTVNKLEFFRLMNETGNSDLIPRYWTNSQDIPSDAFPVYCRTKLKGKDGEGIVVAQNRNELVDAPLYTAFLDVDTEYRVTVFKGGITDIQTKLRRESFEGEPNDFVRTFDNGWGFRRVTVLVNIRQRLEWIAASVLESTGLDFCGLDVVLTNGAEFKILEVNSAMGLVYGALERFAAAVERFVAESYPSTTEDSEGPENGSEGNLEGIQEQGLGQTDNDRHKLLIEALNENDYQQVLIQACKLFAGNS